MSFFSSCETVVWLAVCLATSKYQILKTLQRIKGKEVDLSFRNKLEQVQDKGLRCECVCAKKPLLVRKMSLMSASNSSDKSIQKEL